MAQAPELANFPVHPAARSVAGQTLIILTGALILAALMSTQFLAQPFVWRYFAGDEIYKGWLLIFRDRLLVTTIIGYAVCVALRLPGRGGRGGFLPVLVAVVAGATLAESVLAVIDPQSDRMGLMALSGRILRWSVVAGGACLILYLWRRTEEAGDLEEAAELQQAQAERLLTKVRIEALQRQIEPHFLFNTLATVRRLQRSSPDDGRRLLSRLMNFLYANFDSRAGADQLGRELTVVEAYLDVCAMRMGGLLGWSINVPAELHTLKFPRFGLATLVENAVKHGIAPSPAGGTITVAAHVDGGMLELSVIDTGSGFAADHGTGIGLANIAAHLRLCFGDTASLRLTANSPSGVCATIRLSAQTGP